MAILTDNVGTVFEAQLTDGGAPVDISGASTFTIRFRLPDGTILDQPATLSTDGTDGKLEYAAAAGFLAAARAGLWHWQPLVSWEDGTQYAGAAQAFRVQARLAAA